MTDLNQCPCGKWPNKLHIFPNGQGGKWANVAGDCCGEWTVEFRTQYQKSNSAPFMRLATEAWNEAPRGMQEKVI